MTEPVHRDSARVESATTGAVRPGTGWWVEWATGGPIDGATGAVPGHADFVRSVTKATVEGRPVAVTGDRDGRVQVWDVDTRTEVVGRGRPTSYTGPVWALAAAVVVLAPEPPCSPGGLRVAWR